MQILAIALVLAIFHGWPHFIWFSTTEKVSRKSDTLIAYSDNDQKATDIFIKLNHRSELQGNRMTLSWKIYRADMGSHPSPLTT